MKHIKKIGMVLAVMLFCIVALFTGSQADDYQAASSYTNAKLFYESTYKSEKDSAHAEAVNGSFYFATCSKKAASSTNLKYQTLGFDVSLSANGYTVSFAVKRGDSMPELIEAGVDDGTYVYNLYCIETEALYELGSTVNASAMEKIKKADKIRVKVDAIMTLKKGNTLYGSIEEDGKGGITESGSRYVYHLKEETDLQAMRNIFSGHDFKSYYNINRDLNNFALTIYYIPTGTEEVNATASTEITLGNGYTSQNGRLYKGNAPFYTKSYLLQKFSLLETNEAVLERIGYHLPENEEWLDAYGKSFSDSALYMPKDIEPAVGFKNTVTVLYANWQPNEYTIIYNAAGGSGTVAPTKHYYDNTEAEYLAENTFYRNGYYLPEGEEWIDADGNTHASGEAVHNWTSVHKKEIVLYANWKPAVVAVQTDPRGGSGGTEVFYEKFDTGFSLNTAFVPMTQRITAPQKTGYAFLGYFKNIFGTGDLIVGSDGKIEVSPDYFDKDSMIYAKYEALPFEITFDKQGGYAGTNKVTATYGEVLPAAGGPVRTGYSFKGYYTEPGGKGELYYNEFMSPVTQDGELRVYTALSDMTLYAYWIDESAPELYFVSSTTKWTNREITLTATAVEYGIGLSSLTIYQGDTPVAQKTNLNGATTCVLDYINDVEGVTNYKAVAVDLNGNTVEAYLTTKYDITPPSGEILDFVMDEDGIRITVDVTDINTGK